MAQFDACHCLEPACKQRSVGIECVTVCASRRFLNLWSVEISEASVALFKLKKLYYSLIIRLKATRVAEFICFSYTYRKQSICSSKSIIQVI